MDKTKGGKPGKTGKPGKPGKTAEPGKPGKPGKCKGAAAEPETHRCFHCDSEGSEGAKLMSCSQCHRAWYCGRPCQKKHWKQHKKACLATVAAEARRAGWRAAAAASRREGGGRRGRRTDELCVICVGPVRSPVELPCGHAYCGACLAELRAKEVAQTCPLCRADLPEGLDGLHDLAIRAYCRIKGIVDRGQASWASLSAAEQEEMDEVIAMLTGAAAQVSSTQCCCAPAVAVRLTSAEMFQLRAHLLLTSFQPSKSGPRVVAIKHGRHVRAGVRSAPERRPRR